MSPLHSRTGLDHMQQKCLLHFSTELKPSSVHTGFSVSSFPFKIIQQTHLLVTKNEILFLPEVYLLDSKVMLHLCHSE